MTARNFDREAAEMDAFYSYDAFFAQRLEDFVNTDGVSGNDSEPAAGSRLPPFPGWEAFGL